MLKLPQAGHSLWRDAYNTSLYPALDWTLTVDVVIVGAGISGLTTAYLLKMQGFTVAVLEKDTVGGGTSGRTTGKVTSQHNIIYNELLSRHGRGVTRQYAQMNQQAVEQVASIIQAEGIDCDWSRQDNYIYTTDQKSVQRLRTEARVAAEVGLPSSFEVTTPLPFSVLGAVKFTDQAKFNSQKYLLGLARAIHGDGSYIFERSKVRSIQKGKPAKVGTARGKVMAGNAVIATNVPTLPLIARGTYCAFEYPQESYIVAGKIPQPLTGMYISPDKHHYSILPFEIDGQPGVLVGGEGHLSGLRVSTQAKYKKLAKYAEENFGMTEVTHCWADRDYMAYDRLPLIGRMYPRHDNLYVASAYRKWGLSGSTAAGMILSDLIADKDNPYAATFAPLRLKAAASFPRAVVQYITGKE